MGRVGGFFSIETQKKKLEPARKRKGPKNQDSNYIKKLKNKIPTAFGHGDGFLLTAVRQLVVRYGTRSLIVTEKKSRD